MKTALTHEMPGQPRKPNPLKRQRDENKSFFPDPSDREEALATTTKKFEPEPVIRIKPKIDKLINTVLSAGISRRNRIVNEVAANVQLAINENKLALVVGNLINNIVTFAQDDCLHVCYLPAGEIVLHLENTDLSRNKSFIASLETILIIARRFGINLKIEEIYGKGSDVSVHFVKNAA